MTRQRRNDDWGFPRWRPYGAKGRDAVRVRLCDRVNCEQPGDRPAPKSPNSKERWYFCEAHAGEYNKNWNYFEGLNEEQKAAREAEEMAGASAFRQSAHYEWGGPGDGSRSREEMRALSILGLDSDADYKAVRTAYRLLAKEHHPDLKQGDKDAEQRFREIQAAYDVLKRAEERREASPVRG